MRKGTFLPILALTMIVAAFSPVLSTAQATVPAIPGFPTFAYQGVVINPDANRTRYPTGEVIFPSIIRAADYFPSPLGTYYLYYAPHENPGGIFMAYSNSITGPWTHYGSGPLIRNNWPGNHSVSHVSSPHVIWNSTERRLFLYYHGENTTTRLATSANGLSWTYDSAVIGCQNFGWSSCEVSYARVFEQAIPGKNNKYLMVMMGRRISGGSCCNRNIMLAWSNNGRSWTAQTTPLITPQGAEGTDIASPTLFRWNGCMCVVYHASSGNVHVTNVGANFNQQTHLGVLYDDPTGLRAASPSFISVGGLTYMFYEQGPRLNAKIAYAVER